MRIGLPIKLVFVGVLLSAAATLIWRSTAPVISPSSHEERPESIFPTRATPRSPSPTSMPPDRPAATAKIGWRAQYRESRNYAEFVRGLGEAASAGDPIAQYLTASALKYCSDSGRIHQSFRNPDGSLRTRSEIDARVAKYPVGLQQEILEAYDRCREFAEDTAQPDATAAWESWLDKASLSGYAPAQSLKADVSRQIELMRDAANASSGDIIPPTAGAARDLALTAVTSGDPDSIWEMMNWVDGTKHSTEDYGALVGAWGLLACQRGYDDCGASSRWLRSVCSWDVQCADDSSVIDFLRRQFGSRFDDVQSIADAIGQAIDQRDEQAVESYL